MNVRRPKLPLVALPALFLTALPTTPVAQEIVTSVSIDPASFEAVVRKRPGRTGDRGTAPAAEVLEQGLRVQLDGDRPVMLVMFYVKVRDGRAVAEYRGRPFEAAPGREYACCRSGVVVPDREFFGRAVVDGDHLVSAPESVVASEAGTPKGAAAQIVDGVFPERPDDWQKGEAIYVVAIPADPQVLRSARAHPIALYVKN